MCRFVRFALPAILAGMFCLALATAPALANCPAAIALQSGPLGNQLGAGCGTSPFAAFWAIANGNPATGAGIDSGTAGGLILFEPSNGVHYYSGDWGEAGVDGCVQTLSPDGINLPPVGVIINNATGEGTPSRDATLLAFYNSFSQLGQFYVLDFTLGFDTLTDCLPIPTPHVPAAGGIVDQGNGTFNVNASWGAITTPDDCTTNPDAACPGGGPVSILTGYQLYTQQTSCTVGPTTGAVASWTAVGPLQTTLSATVNVPAPAPGLCKFLAMGPKFESGFGVGFVSHTATSSPEFAKIVGNGDADGDAILDRNDNCGTLSNASQADADGDFVGDACDNCPGAVNYDQADFNSNGHGDVCDNCPDSGDLDGDGLCDPDDNCPGVANAGQEDGDADGLGDACDACPMDPFNDVDADGRCGNVDNCPDVANANQSDKDGDGKGDVCDPCPFEKFDDLDTDGKCACDVALGNAGVCGTYPNITDGNGNPADNCAVLYNPTQTASGFGDGLGSACEDTFSAADVFWTSFYGPCTVRFKTSMEWNCPKFRVKNLGSTKATFPCMECTNGRGQLASYYGGDAGVSIGKCLAGFLVWVEASRSNPNDCAGFVVPKQATKKFPYKVGTRIHLP